MGRDDVHQWGFLPPTEAPSLYTQEQRDDHWRHFDKSVNAISFGFVATAILISMFLVMAIFERFLRTSSPVLSPDGGGGGGRNAAGEVDSQMGFNSKFDHSSLKISENAREVSVLMPGEDVPTFIAQPAPVPCPSERIPWLADPRISYPKLTSNSNS
ncbi:uncharacterized protein LOC112523575 [Cynara cardunculus var. scolymus]|uniref:Uncharacterized protein n=1 Tax=Cynara cardunculus var. scolymus TaxID=59895 RepID=A0A118JY08_CYNCS|nr:uncharacterized protein LOC112523575 [Cynara cardunculus var. scolymus]KVH96972.1 hypothetical protein Ccrd_000934 [Cynara cardunculus var. scolymus]